VCGKYCLSQQKQKITKTLKKLYHEYFGCKLGDQDKPWAPHVSCKTCFENLKLWKSGKRKSMSFGVPMIWREPRNHYDDCYFCMVKVKGINTKNKKSITYPDVDSAMKPVHHSADIPIPNHKHNEVEDLSSSDCSDNVILSESNESEDTNSCPILITQKKLNDLVRDLALTKDSSLLLSSRLKEWNMLAEGTTFNWYLQR